MKKVYSTVIANRNTKTRTRTPMFDAISPELSIFTSFFQRKIRAKEQMNETIKQT
jgi:hypothetical protein